MPTLELLSTIACLGWCSKGRLALFQCAERDRPPLISLFFGQLPSLGEKSILRTKSDGRERLTISNTGTTDTREAASWLRLARLRLKPTQSDAPRETATRYQNKAPQMLAAP